MSKFYGSIGFAQTSETSPGIWEEKIVERKYYGDVTKNTRRYNLGDAPNGTVDINNEFSIVADPYAYQNFASMRYLEWHGAKWIISSVEELYPRLKLTVGGLYNE